MTRTAGHASQYHHGDQNQTRPNQLPDHHRFSPTSIVTRTVLRRTCSPQSDYRTSDWANFTGFDNCDGLPAESLVGFSTSWPAPALT
ncbi:MAG TPA: hypothetical protein DCE39_09030 [Planctomycetaceae bacterium]|nr:hypothetical protein [Planctomycetaceae bacterium]